jgi:sugar lactone lactonase YvrE
MIIPAGARGAAEGDMVDGSFGSLIGKSWQLAEVARLAKSGKKLAAIKLYRELSGTGLKEAKEAVEQIERGEPVSFTERFIQTGSPARHSNQSLTDAHVQAVTRISKAIIWPIIGVVLIVAVISVVLALRRSEPPKSPPQVNITVPDRVADLVSSAKGSTATPGFAGTVMEFGSEGIGAGQFKDARSVAVDGEGRIYVGEYTGGRVQAFDSQGKFITQWMVDQKRALLNLAVDRKGTVYIVHPGQILRYDGPTGNLLGEVPAQHERIKEFYSDVFVALDGSLYAIGSNSNILRIDAGGNIKTVVNLKERLDENVGLDKIAVDGAGNVYALTEHECTVLKFGPDGRFINRFGGRGDQPGQFRAPQNIAVDGQGRVYVSDMMRAINVFDGNGRYLTFFGGSDIVFGMAINDQNEIFASHRNRNKIVKYALSK